MSASCVLSIQAEPGAGLLCRLVGLLAQRDLDIAAMEVRADRGGMADIRIKLAGIDPHGAQVVADKMARVIGVFAIKLEISGADSGVAECCEGRG